MSKFSDKIKKFLLNIFNDEIKKNLKFFSKSKVLDLLKGAAIIALGLIISKLKDKISQKLNRLIKNNEFLSKFFPNVNSISDSEIESYVKADKNIQIILNYVNKDLNDDIVSDITLACNNPNYYNDNVNNMLSILSDPNKNLSENDYIKIAQNSNDFFNKLDNKANDIRSKLLDSSNKFKNYLNEHNILIWIILTYYVVLKTKEFFEQSDNPSPYRGKFLQKLIRTIASFLKSEKQAIKKSPDIAKEGGKEILEEIEEITSFLFSIDSLIIGGLMASFVYIQNRKLLQQESKNTLNEISSSFACDKINDENIGNEIINVQQLNFNSLNNLNNICPIDSEPKVPHEPYENKISNERLKSCDINQGPNLNNDIKETNIIDLTTKAIFENNSKKVFKIKIKKGQRIDNRTILGSLGNESIYSSIEGIVTIVQKNKITVDDISDTVTSFLTEQIEKIQNLYTELNNIKFFIKDFYAKSSYPILLKESPLIDASINATEFINIRYFTGGVSERYNELLKNIKNLEDSFNKNTQKITGKDNVKEKAENNNLISIQTELNKVEKLFYESIKTYVNNAKNESNITLPKESEFELIDYYVNLFNEVLSQYDQNNIIISFRNNLSSIISNRYFIDGWDKVKLKNKINDICINLAKGTFLANSKDYFNNMLISYNETKNIDKIKYYIESIGKDNTELTEEEKTKLVDKVIFIFEFYLQTINLIDSNFSISSNKYQAVTEEANYIENYFNNLWKRYNEIPNEIKSIEKILDNLGKTLTIYSIIEIEGEQYRYYGIGKERECAIPSEDGDEYISPFSSVQDFSDIKYWLKYCSIATLTSVANPTTGWSTGLPPPIGPIPFPVVYIPIKAFQLNWGFIVIGITITGLYIFPFVLFVNYSTDYCVPLADPSNFIKKNIKKLKIALSKEFKEYRRSVLKNYLDNTAKEINDLNLNIDNITKSKQEHKTQKPKRDRTKKNGRIEYIQNLNEWTAIQIGYNNDILKLKTERFKKEIKYKIVYNAYSGQKVEENSDQKITNIKKSEESIDKKFITLEDLIDSVNVFLAPMPISTKPVSANFGLTIKNPKPIINFASDLDNTINNSALNPVIEKYKVKNEDLMSTNFKNKSSESIVNYKKYIQALKVAMPFIIEQDPFPKYENLKLTNLQWISFLYLYWTPIGAQTYGIPGFLPFPKIK